MYSVFRGLHICKDRAFPCSGGGLVLVAVRL
jgi:hypothetical protein